MDVFLNRFFKWLLIFGGVCAIEGFSQIPIAQPEVRTFSRNQYGGGSQNWAMASDSKKRLYVANNEGVLVLNGKQWQLFPVPNKTIIRSISFGPGGNLFVGAQDELGYFSSDKVGRLRYSSLKHLVAESEQKFPDVWQIKTTETDVFFRTNKVIFQYVNQTIVSHKTSSTWLSIHRHQGKIIAHEQANGLKEWSGGQWQILIEKEKLPVGFAISDLIDWRGDTSLVSTEKNGLYLFASNHLIPFSISGKGIQNDQHFTSIAPLDNHSFLVGTYFNGLYRISNSGKVLGSISDKNGLRNNTIRCLYSDSLNAVWIGLDNGIAYYEPLEAIRHILPETFKNGVGYSVARYNNELYFALSTGIQYLPTKSAMDLGSITESPIPIIKGLSWKVIPYGDQLLAGRDDGFWTIKNHKATPIDQRTGFWTCQILPGKVSDFLVAGNYLGLHFFSSEKGRLIDKGKLKDFSESCRYLEVDHGRIWVSHPYRGVFRIDPATGTYEFFKQRDGLPADLNNHVFSIKGKVLFATSKGIYEFDSANKKMKKSKWLEPVFGELPIRFLKEDSEGNIWFVQEKMVGVVDFKSGKPVLHYIPELKNKISSGFENIFPIDNRNLFIGSDEGFYHLNFEKYRERIKPFSVYLTQIKTIGGEDSVVFGGFQFGPNISEAKPEFPYRLNSLQFSFAASIFDLSDNLEFSYYLEGFDKNWSPWSAKSDKDYTNLPDGKFTFKLKARRGPSHESSVFSFTFVVNPPFYQTIWAWLLYGLIFIGFLYAVLKFQAKRYRRRQEARLLEDQKRFEEEQREMAYQHQLELEQTEKELIKLQNEKLEGEIEHKNAELASATMNLVQKKEFILKLKGELQQLQKTNKVADDQPELKKLLKTLSEEEKLNKEWDHFAQHFDSVYGDFLTTLKCKFPALKPHELQLCAYLRMNLSSKEIAPLMSISVRGVEIGRYRLRKKLNLSTEENLAQFLMDISE